MDGDHAVDPEPSIRSMGGDRQPSFALPQAHDRAEQGEQVEVLPALGHLGASNELGILRRSGPEHAPALEIRRSDPEPADDPGDPHLDRSPRDHRRQELRREGALLGGGQALERFTELLPEAHPIGSVLSVLEFFDL